MAAIHITLNDGTTQVVPPLGIADYVALERHTGIPAGELGERAARVEWTLFLAWNSLRRHKVVKDSFEDWLDTVADLDAPDADAEGEEAAEGAVVPPPPAPAP